MDDESFDDRLPPVYSERAYEAATSWGICVVAALWLLVILLWKGSGQ